MPSVISGYEYDIFISYRQKDNLSTPDTSGFGRKANDGWVTGFVANLKKELEATFKEDISIYFDENPHDGLLETHHVDKSLEGKLKCLIFIPIISQTYCDPKSFAWQQEFCSFNKLAKEDQFGRDIILNNGNVASRILPIKIHDLDADDRALLENELGGVLRAVEFIYKSPGVNRPLTSSDNPDKNQNKTFYRDQVNKAANAIKEIITALKSPVDRVSFRTHAKEKKSSLPNGSPKKSIKQIVFASIGLMILFALIYSVSQYMGSAREEAVLDKSIAVLPFANLSSDREQEYFSDGLTDDIITQLAKIKSIKVISRTSIMLYKQNTRPLRELGEELGVAVVLEGSVQRSGDQVRIRVQLIKAATDEHLWAESYDRPTKDIFTIQREVATAIASVLKTTLSGKETQHLSQAPTASLVAYDLYLRGKYLMERRRKPDMLKAMEFFQQSVEVDSAFTLALSGLADAYLLSSGRGYRDPQKMLPPAKTFIDRGISLDPTSGEAHASLGYWYVQNLNFRDAEIEYRKAIKLNPNQANVYNWLGNLLGYKGEFEEAIKIYDKGIEVNPMWPLLTANKASCKVRLGRAEEAISLFREQIEDNSNDQEALGIRYSNLARLYWRLGRKKEAIYAAEKASYKGLLEFYRDGDNSILINYAEARRRDFANSGEYLSQLELGAAYAEAGEHEKALTCFKKAIAARDPSIVNLLSGDNPEWEEVRKKIRTMITF